MIWHVMKKQKIFLPALLGKNLHTTRRCIAPWPSRLKVSDPVLCEATLTPWIGKKYIWRGPLHSLNPVDPDAAQPFMGFGVEPMPGSDRDAGVLCLAIADFPEGRSTAEGDGVTLFESDGYNVLSAAYTNSAGQSTSFGPGGVEIAQGSGGRAMMFIHNAVSIRPLDHNIRALVSLCKSWFLSFLC